MLIPMIPDSQFRIFEYVLLCDEVQITGKVLAAQEIYKMGTVARRVSWPLLVMLIHYAATIRCADLVKYQSG